LLYETDFIYSGDMAPSLKFRFKPDLDNVSGQAEPYYPLAHGEDVGVIMLPGSPGRKGVVALGRPDAGHLVRGYGYANTRAAADHTPFKITALHRFRHLQSDIRVVYRILAKGSKIGIFYAALPEEAGYMVFQSETTVIAR
jgi:hypothetical protein